MREEVGLVLYTKSQGEEDEEVPAVLSSAASDNGQFVPSSPSELGTG